MVGSRAVVDRGTGRMLPWTWRRPYRRRGSRGRRRCPLPRRRRRVVPHRPSHPALTRRHRHHRRPRPRPSRGLASDPTSPPTPVRCIPDVARGERGRDAMGSPCPRAKSRRRSGRPSTRDSHPACAPREAMRGASRGEVRRHRRLVHPRDARRARGATRRLGAPPPSSFVVPTTNDV